MHPIDTHGALRETAPSVGAQPERTISVSNGAFGCEVQPLPPLQDMAGSIDTIAGQVHDRTDSQATFTGGYGTPGADPVGGMAEPPGTITQPVP